MTGNNASGGGGALGELWEGVGPLSEYFLWGLKNKLIALCESGYLYSHLR